MEFYGIRSKRQEFLMGIVENFLGGNIPIFKEFFGVEDKFHGIVMGKTYF